MAAKKKAAPKATKRKRTTKLAPNAVKRGLSATEVALALDHEDIAAVVELVRKAGGAPLGAYREPLGGRPLLLASLPFSAVQPTPFQRDLSPTHAKRLAGAIEATAAFLDPLIVVRGEDGRFWTPNGRHRLAAAKMLGLKQLTVLISPDETLSYRILALNTEKAHNLKDKSLEVVRMARNLAKREPTRTEASLAAEFEAAELLTLGLVYEGNLRFGGGAYSPVLKKVDRLTTRPLPVALRERSAYASRLQEIDNEVKRIVARAAGARHEIALPAQLRGGAYKPRSFPQDEGGRQETRHAHRAGAAAHVRGREEVRPGQGEHERPRVRGRRRGIRRIGGSSLCLARVSSTPVASSVRCGHCGHFSVRRAAFNAPAQFANFLCNRFRSSRVYISVTD